MNLAIALIVIWHLESSCGKKFDHPQPENHGHLGISDIMIRDLNEKLHKSWRVIDCDDRDKSFEMAREYIALYCPMNASLRDVLLLWRCGPTGRFHPSIKQIKYVEHGQSVYKQILKGVALDKLE